MQAPQTKSSSVRFENVTKSFGKNSVAVDSFSAVIEAGKLVTLLGPSGCGKTTTLRMIAGLELPTTGKIFLGDTEITNLPASDRDISMVFQSYALFPHMNVLKNVSYGLKFSGFSNAEAKEKAYAGLNLVGLEHLADRLPSQLSGGQQQRVAVARALVLEPEVLLFDEPLSNLDAKLRRSVREEIRDLQQKLGLTVVYVTHDQEEALAVSDHIIVMKNARLAQQGLPREIYQNPANTFVADFIGEANLFDVDIISIKKGEAEVRLANIPFRVKAGGYNSGSAQVAIRPYHIKIVQGKSKGKNTFPAKLIKATYLGIRMEYTFETDFGSLFVTSLDIDNPLKVGKSTLLYFDPTQAMLVSKEE